MIAWNFSSLSDILERIIDVYIVYLAVLFVYRLLFHPLRHFPGSRLAALTKWHWDYHASDSTKYLKEQHARHGPIIRIGPNELHFSDPSVYNQIYHAGTKFTKDPHFYRCFGGEDSSVCLIDPREAKIRKDLLSPLFSRRAIIKLEHVIQEKVDTLLSQILSYKDHPVDMYYAFRSTTVDVISGYCFAQSFSTLTYPLFQHPILLAMDEAPQLHWVLDAFPFMIRLLLSLPDSLVLRMSPGIKGLFILRNHLSMQIDQLLGDRSILEKAEHETVYHHLMTPQPHKGQTEIPPKKSLLEEAQLLMFAGSDTVGNAATMGVFHVVNNPEIYSKLTQELGEAWPDKDAMFGQERLEKLPYLTAVIKESLRISCGVVSPLPRVVGPSSAEIGGVVVPMGTTVSISAVFIHDNNDIFTDPKKFDPERWLQPNSRELENYLVAFSRGPRSCLGVNLAWCELYLILGNVFRKVNMEVYDTNVEDFNYKAYFLPTYTGKHFRAMVSERES